VGYPLLYNKESMELHLIIIPRQVDKKRMPKTDGGTMYTQILTDAQLKTGNRCQKTELIGRSLLKRRRSAMDCSVI
jgi:hypothetical protein